MLKVFIKLLFISIILGNARAQSPQIDMRIGSFNNIKNQNLSNDNSDLKSLDLEPIQEVTALEGSISPVQYILGPGDKLLINFFGNENSEIEVQISREGKIALPKLGPVSLLGLTFEDANNFIKNKVKTELIGTDVSVSLKELRSINVYLLGEAYSPGQFTLSALSTVTNALFVSGGVNENGSLRNIQIKRGNETIANYDFYDFLLRGSLSSDVRLQDGDIEPLRRKS